MVKDDSDNSSSRRLNPGERRFLRNAAVTLFAAGAVGGFFVPKALERGRDDVRFAPSAGLVTPEYVSLGDNTQKVKQAHVVRHYGKIYDTLKQAKEEARREGKPLAVLQAEWHIDDRNFDAFLGSLMVNDAEDRLNIPRRGLEIPDRTAAAWNDNLEKVIQPQYEKYRDKHAESLIMPAKLSPQEEQLRKMMVLPYLLNGLKNDRGKPIDSFMGEFFTNSIVAGIKTEAFDPKREERKVKMDRDEFDTTGEKEMADAMAAKPGDVGGRFGAFHVPGVADLLIAKGYKVVIIDTMNDTIAPLPNDFAGNRLRELAKRRDLQVVIEGAPVFSPGEAFIRASAASLEHQGVHPVFAAKQGNNVADPLGMLEPFVEGMNDYYRSKHKAVFEQGAGAGR